LFSRETKSQGIDSLSMDLFSLYENASDQEGMFYLPQVKKSGFLAGSKMLNEKRLQSAIKTSNYNAIIQSATNLAWLEVEQENYEKAINYFDEAIKAHAASGNTIVVRCFICKKDLCNTEVLNTTAQ
jgi:tetratricopeptide (TPR) repeat protein